MDFLLERMNSLVESSAAAAASYGAAEEFTSLFDNNFADQFLNSIEDDDDDAEFAARRATAEQLILELEQEIKDEPDTTWLSSVPIVFDPSTSPAPSSPATSSMFVDETCPKNTEELLFEFDAVCNAVGITPPASPPAQYLEGAPIYYVEEVDAEMLLEDSSDNFIDELVRCHSSSLPDDLSEISSSPRSDISSPARSDSSFDVAGYDDEWRPASAPEVKRKKRPYGRPIEEKKVRKKEQNKNAATRYRQKKKQQLEVILDEEDALKAVHMQLQTKFDDTKREINYLKKLMREILIAKGVTI